MADAAADEREKFLRLADMLDQRAQLELDRSLALKTGRSAAGHGTRSVVYGEVAQMIRATATR